MRARWLESDGTYGHRRGPFGARRIVWNPGRTASMTQTATRAADARMMERCIALAKTGTQQGEFPFACVIVKDGEVVVAATSRGAQDGDVTRHAELIAVSLAQTNLGTKDLSGCTLYTTVEPCAMCSFPIRETRISRVVYARSEEHTSELQSLAYLVCRL